MARFPNVVESMWDGKTVDNMDINNAMLSLNLLNFNMAVCSALAQNIFAGIQS